MDLIKDCEATTISNDCYKLISKQIDTLSFYILELCGDFMSKSATHITLFNSKPYTVKCINCFTRMKYEGIYSTRLSNSWFCRNFVKKATIANIRGVADDKGKLLVSHKSIFPNNITMDTMNHFNGALNIALQSCNTIVNKDDISSMTKHLFLLLTANPYHPLPDSQKTICINKIYNIMLKNNLYIREVNKELTIDLLTKIFNDIIDAPINIKTSFLYRFKFGKR